MISASSSWAQSFIAASAGTICRRAKEEKWSVVSKHKTELLVFAPRRAELMVRAPAFVKATKVEVGDLSPSASAGFNICRPSSWIWRTAAGTNDWIEITTPKITSRNVRGEITITVGHSSVFCDAGHWSLLATGKTLTWSQQLTLRYVATAKGNKIRFFPRLSKHH